MQIHLSPRHMTLTAAIHSYVCEKVMHLEEMAPTLIAAHIVILHDETKKKRYVVKVHLALPGPDIHAEDAEDDLYAAIDLTINKLTQQLRKNKTKRSESKKHKLRLAKEAMKRGLKE
ncbi:MAG: ribosome-associated translation inhibitor RaiA [Chthoniobacterales bacterium]|nr:ribosome-associated translation inhibitor RaiA [Chthoniobacterales bacterium]